MAKRKSSKKAGSSKTTKRKPTKVVRSKPSFDDLMEACEKGDLEFVRDCVNSRVSVKKKDEYGFTPMMRAVVQEWVPLRTQLEIVRCLVAAGSNLEAKTDDGRTALYLAAEFCKKKDILEVLVEAGAKIEIPYPVHILINANTPAIRKYLETVLGKKAKDLDTDKPKVEKRKSKKLTDSEWRKAKKKVTEVFASLEAQSIVTLQNAGTTQEDGFSDCSEVVHERGGLKKSGVIGFCFFTKQDAKRAQSSGELCLAFWGAPKGSKRAMTKVGKLVCKSFRDAGFVVEWSEQSGDRPSVFL